MIDLCVVNHNTCGKIIRLLDGLARTTPSRGVENPVLNLRIADNGSTDGSHEYLENLAKIFPKYRIRLNENIGYSAACNQMAAEGTGDIIGLLNADIWFTYHDIETIQAIFDSDLTISILGPKQRDENGLIRHAGIIGTNTAPRHRGWGASDPEDILYKDRIDCVTVSGSAYFIRRSVWNELWNCPIYRQAAPNATGAFLPTPHFYEETFCSYHATAHGHRVVYDGSVSIGHSWHASSPIGSQDEKFHHSQSIFRAACALHGIACD